MDHYRQSLSILPGQVKPLFRMGLLLEHRGDIDGAVEHYRLAASSSRKAAISRCNLAGILANRGEHIEAASLLEEAREAAPRDVQILSQLGAVYVTMGRLPEAREAFSRAAELSPRNAKAHQDLGILLAKMGEPRLAVTHLSMAAELEPDNAAHFTNLGVMLHQTRQSARAVQAFDISLTIAPDLHSTLKNLAWILATDPDPAVRNPARAVELARKASKLVGPDNPVYLDTLAAALAAAGDFPQAVATAEHAATIARDGGATALADNIQRRLDLYRTQQPFIAATKP
jgi:Flp pilus assembly protein TadD